MEEEKRKFNIKTHIITAIISLIVGGGIFCLYFFLNEKTLIAAVDATGIAAICLICFGGLMFIGREGFFDIFAYGFKQLGTQIFGRVPNAYNDFAGYKEEKNTVRKVKSRTFITVLIVGFAFLIAFIILDIKLSN